MQLRLVFRFQVRLNTLEQTQKANMPIADSEAYFENYLREKKLWSATR